MLDKLPSTIAPKRIEKEERSCDISTNKKRFQAALLAAAMMSPGNALAQDSKQADIHHDLDHDRDHGGAHKHKHDPKWEGSLSAAIFPAETKKVGGEFHIARIIGNHHEVHFEVIVADVGFAYEPIPIEGDLWGQRKGIDRYEFHVGAGVGVGIPIGNRFVFSVSQGLGLGFNYYPFQSMGYTDASQKQIMNFTETVEFAPIYKMHFELNFSLTENVFITTGFAPHITLTPVFHDVETTTAKQKKEHHSDFPVMLGLGIEL